MSNKDEKSDLLDEQHGVGTAKKPFFLFRPLVYNPLAVIFGQLCLFFLAWGFYAATYQRPVPLPNYLAEAGRDFPSGITFVVTLISVSLASLCKYLYGLSIRHALAMRLSKPMALHLVALTVKLSQTKFVLSLRYWGWSLLALFNLALLGAQTAAWNALFTPRVIAISSDMTGWGLDVSNSDFIQMVIPLLAVETTEARFPFSPDQLITTAPVFQESGSASVNAFLDSPGSVSFNGRSFTNSTRGIMPVFLYPTNSSVQAGALFRPTVEVIGGFDSPEGFDINYTLTQQGLMVDINCGPRDPGLAAEPAFSVLGTTLVQVGLNLTCPGVEPTLGFMTIATPTEQAPSGNTVLSGSCRLDEVRHELVIRGDGTYGFFGVRSCVVAPHVAKIDVTYSRNAALLRTGSTPDIITISEPYEARDVSNLGIAPFTFTERVFWQHQSNFGNTVGDYISVIHTFYAAQPDILDRALEAYLKGVFEFGGTLLQAVATQSNSLVFDDSTVPESMRYQLTGKYFASTLGWHHRSNNLVPGVLVLISIVALASVVLAVMAVVASIRNQLQPGQESLDLGDLMQILSTGLPETRLPPVGSSEGTVLDRGKELAMGLEDSGDGKSFVIHIN